MDDKFCRDAKLFIALWENTAANLKRCNVTECIEQGADVNVRFAHSGNNTPLHVAVTKQDKDIVNILLNHGAKPNVVNDAGKTALQLAKEIPECLDIVEMLIAYEEKTEKTNTESLLHSTPITTTGKSKYKKRPGTANVRGHLYETKLLTTIYLRALRLKQIAQFNLGSNVDEIGDLDDVCMRLKTNKQDSAIFLQAKYRHDINKGKVGVQDLWKSSGDFSLLKYFDSYLRIREKFHPDSEDELFRGRYEDIKPYFVVYTTVKDDIKDTRKKPVRDNIVHDLLITGEKTNIFQFVCEEQYVDTLANVKLLERVKNMGKKIIKLIQDDKYDMMLCDEGIRSFHIILAQKVIKATDINKDGYRFGTFREDFFFSNEQLLVVLRETLYAEIAKYNKLSEEEIEVAIHKVTTEPNAETISDLIGSVLVYDSNNSTLKLVEEATARSFSYQHLLNSVQVAQSVIKEAFQIAGLKKLRKLVFKLPPAFGNVDMTLNKKKSDRRLEYLAGKICDLIKNSADEEGNVIIREGVFTSDKRLETGILGINGGIAGAVGNLLVSDDENNLSFNLDVDSLGENARKLYLKLNERLDDLSKYRFCVELDFPRLTLLPTSYEKQIAKDFFKNLYFYTSQAKEENLEEIATKELQTHEANRTFNKSESRIKSNAMFLKIHNEIQKWWMMDQSVYYLSRNVENFETIFTYLNNKGLLNFLNTLYLNGLYNGGLEFKTDALDVFSVCTQDSSETKLITVHTEALMLTCHKLVQSLKETDHFSFVDVDYVSRVSPNLDILSELSVTDIPVVVIICKDTRNSIYNIEDMIRRCAAKKIILVTSSYDREYECIVVKDDKIYLSDLTEASMSNVLKTQFLYQGVEVTIAEVFREAKHLISAQILQKIITNEKIVLGQTLESSTYEDMKHYYVPRVLELNVTSNNIDVASDRDHKFVSTGDEDEIMNLRKQISPSTLLDHYNFEKITNPHVVLILDAPGIGKSTLLTHLSVNTKLIHPKIWIQRINLIDHTKQFHKWQQNNTKIDKKEVLNFLCDVILTNDTFKGKNTNSDIKLQIVNNDPILASFDEVCPIKSLEINTFLYCFKERNVIFLFDGLDEISPHYNNKVIELLKCLTNHEQASNTTVFSKQLQARFCVWITSRPYNDLKNTLEAEYGESFTLLPFSYYDIYVFVDKYMRRNLNLEMLSQGQLQNIDGFFEYMKRFDLRGRKYSTDTLNITNAQLHGIYMAFVEYFTNEIKLTGLNNNISHMKHWDFNEDILVVWELFKNYKAYYTQATTLSGVPLNVYIAIDYLLGQIKDTSTADAHQRIQKWDLDTKTFAFYERFLETKLKTIRFEGKNSMNLFNPDVKMTCDREMKEFRDKHMKLAYYTAFEKDVLTDFEIEEVKTIMKGMEIGQEKTGLVDSIVNDKPKFVHYTFVEYFAVEYIFEILKTDDSDKQRRILNYFLNYLVLYGKEGFQLMFDLKLKCTPGLANTINRFFVDKHIFQILVQQSRDIDNRKYDTYRYSTVLDIIVSYELTHFAEFLIDAIMNVVNKTNISDFLYIIETGTFLKNLVSTRNTNLLNKIMYCITSVHPTAFYRILGSLWTEGNSPFCATN